MNRKEQVDKILSLRRDLTEDEVQRMIQGKIERVGGLLTEEGVTSMVARELGTDLFKGRVGGSGVG